MADDFEGSAQQSAKADAAALHAALSNESEEARAYLRVQTALAQLQTDNLVEQNAFELSHLRWRRFNDQMKGALQIMVVALGLLIVVGLGVAIWNASRAEGLVVDTFAVPPALSQSGTSGEVVADDMTQKIAAIRDFANANSLAHSKDVRESREDVKVEIPETGISVSQAWRYLRLWLGNERHLSGNLRALPNGHIALTVSLGGSDTFTFSGRPSELGSVEQKAAERVFETVEPINYVLFLSAKGRNAETLQWAARNLSLWTDNSDLAEGYALYADMIHVITGDARRALSLANTGIALDPKSAPPHMESLNASRDLGHDEDVLAQARAISHLRQEDNVGSWRTGPGYPWVRELGAINGAGETGDFAAMSVLPCSVYCSLVSSALVHAEAFAGLHDAANAWRELGRAQSLATAAGGVTAWNPYANVPTVRYFAHIIKADWKSAAGDAQQIADDLMSDKGYPVRLQSLRVQTRAIPLLAHASAAGGHFAAAHKAIDGTPLDCDACLRERGGIDALQKNWKGANYWFARAMRAAPSIPFAYADWGEMLLRKGDLDGAMAKFSIANQKGPHFADALEMWGEALISKSRSDLALAKFEEADKYAPNWGRLHLKWGEALLWSGDKDGAAKQFVTARGLDLTPAEKSELTKAAHG